MAVSANRLELLQIADAVAREKSIDRTIVIAAMEDAIQKAARSRYGAETDVRAEINPKTGELRLSRHMLVVDDGREPGDPDQRSTTRSKRNPAAQVGDTIADAAAADRFRPHRRAVGQAGDRAEGARGRARPPVRGIQGPHRRDRQRHRQARRIRQRRRRSRPRRGDRAPRRDDPARDASATATASAPISTTCAASRAGRRSSCRAPIRSSWPSCSPRKCRRSMTASSRSRRSPAIRARAPRSR